MNIGLNIDFTKKIQNILKNNTICIALLFLITFFSNLIPIYLLLFNYFNKSNIFKILILIITLIIWLKNDLTNNKLLLIIVFSIIYILIYDYIKNKIINANKKKHYKK